MQIPAVGHAEKSSHAMELIQARKADHRHREPSSVKGGRNALKAQDAGAPTGSEIAQPSTTSEEGGRGVIRLIEEGHFKGVADVRLRINFFDELSSRAQRTAVAATPEQVAKVVETVEAGIDQLVGTLGVTDEATQAAVDDLIEAFKADVDQVVADQTTDNTVDGDELAEAISSVFAQLVDKLGELLNQPQESPEPSTDAQPPPDASEDKDDAVTTTNDPTAAIQPPTSDAVVDGGDPLPTDGGTIGDAGDGGASTDGAPPEDGTGTTTESPQDPPVTFDDAIAVLTAAFDETIADLMDAITQSVQLPDPSPPGGRGGAYEKFLAMYNELRGADQVIDEHV